MEANRENTYHYLEFEQIFLKLRNRCKLSITRDCFIALTEHQEKSIIIDDFSLQKQLFTNFEQNQIVHSLMSSSFMDDPNLDEKIDLLIKGSSLELKDLFNISRMLSFYVKLESIKETSLYKDEFSLKSESYKHLRTSFINIIGKYFDENHTFQPSSYPPLQKIWKKIQDLEGQIRGTIKLLGASDLYLNCLQYSSHDLINDHFVLPVRSDRYQKEHGTIITKSSQGATLYVEPFEIRDLSGNRIQLLAEYDEIVLKLERELSAILTSQHIILSHIYNTTKVFDFLFTKLSYGISFNGCFPKISNSVDINLRDFYHPLIHQPIMNSLELPNDLLGVLISGSNTGGKSVYLKSIAIAHQFLKLGLLIPAKEATIPFFKSIFYYSSDRQNLEEGLSSFSSEALDYIHLLEQVGDHSSLILIDEIFSSTSSKEASALACGIIDHLKHQKSTKLLISTHHEELKINIHQNLDFKMKSASVQFDVLNSKPLYKVDYGSPGPSHAIEIFKNLNRNRFPGIVSYAIGSLGENAINYKNIILEIEEKSIELSRSLNEARFRERELETKLKNLEGQVYLEKKQITDAFKLKLQKILDKAFDIQKEIKVGNKISLKKLNQESQKLKSEFYNESEAHKQINPSQKKNIDEGLIKEGISLFSEKLGRKVLIVNVNVKKRMAQVADKNFKAWVPYLDLKELDKNQSQQKRVVVNITKTTNTSITLDARGLRLEDFQKEVEDRFQYLLVKDIPYLTIIHGHGEGILKSWLRKYLRKCSDFSWEANLDHDGSTVVKLKV